MAIHRHSGFTVVELIVVIAIIGVLIAVLLPSLSTARKVAQVSVCASSQRQIGVAFEGYVHNWNRTYPFANPADTTTGGYTNPAVRNNWPDARNFPWMMAISPYLGNYTRNNEVSVLRCPANPWPAYAATSQSRPATTYGLNTSTFPSNWHSSQAGFPLVAAFRDTRLKVPAATLLIGEVPNGSLANSLLANYSDITTDATRFWASQSSIWQTVEFCRWGRVNHPGISWNSLFADGHVRNDSKTLLMLLAAPLYTGATSGEGARFWANY